jgi:dTDP-4-amino-4,6-dideoxygalactose transaminase
MDEMQAAILRLLLPKLDAMNERRKWIYQQYISASSDCSGDIIFIDNGKQDFVSHLAVIRSSKRDELREFLFKEGISTDIHYPILDQEQEAWQEFPSEIDGSLVISKTNKDKVLSLPCFPTMTDNEVSRIVTALISWEKYFE